MGTTIRIGTRESQLALWQATRVQELLTQHGYAAELVPIKSEGDIDLQTPLYEMGVQGIFTRSLDTALLNGKIDLAVHSMKDVPTQLPAGIVQAAVLKRGSHKDILVFHPELSVAQPANFKVSVFITGSGDQTNGESRMKIPLRESTGQELVQVATSSIRRKAQWLNRFPEDKIENLRGNVNTRLRKLKESNWHGAIFAAAGLERINLRPENSIELDWMLPAPAQGAIVVVCRDEDRNSREACSHFNDTETALCTRIERDFLRALLGGCSTPVSALAEIKNGRVHFRGNILSVDGKEKAEVSLTAAINEAISLGTRAAVEILQQGGQEIADGIRHAGK